MTPLVLPDFDHNAVQVNDRVNRIQWSRLPFDHLLDDGIRDLGNQRGRYIGTVHFFEGAHDLASRHALRVQEQNLVVHRRETALMLLHQLWLEAAGPVTRGGQLKRAVLGLQGLVGNAVAIVVRVGLLVLVEAEMIVQLRVQRRFNRDLGQHLPECVEVFFRLDVLRRRLGDCLELFLLHNLPILSRYGFNDKQLHRFCYSLSVHDLNNH